MRSSVACVLLLALPCSAQPEGWPHRTYSCERIASAPTIDGDPSEWAGTDLVPWTEPFVDIEGDKKPEPRFTTQAAMAWDDDYFYIAAEMEEPHLWGTLTRHDSILHHQNNFEVFIDPDGDTQTYHELQINVLNTVFDLLLDKPYRHGGRANIGWHVDGVITAVNLRGTPNDPSDTDEGWSVEIAIPWSALAPTAGAPCPPAAGDMWRVNFSRVEWQLVQTEDGYTKTINERTNRAFPEDNWVWSPQRVIDMHEPQFWGFVEFASQPEPTLSGSPQRNVDAAAGPQDSDGTP